MMAFQTARCAASGLDTIEWHYLEQVKKTLRIGERFELYKARLDEALFGDDRIHCLKSMFASMRKNHIRECGESTDQYAERPRTITKTTAESTSDNDFCGETEIHRAPRFLEVNRK